MIKRFAVLLSAMLFSCLSASAQKYQDGLVDKIVALIGNDAIMLSDIEGEAQMMRANGYIADRNGRCEILEQLMVSKLFLTQARLDSLVASATEVQDNLTQRIASITTQLGGEKAMEEYFNKSRYDLEKLWRESIEEQMLTQKMQQQVISAVPKLTPKDVKAFADTTAVEDMPVIPDQYRLRQIVLYPDKDSAATLVKERLLEIRERIVNGEKFTSLARLYSEDPGSASRGGELGMANKTVYWPAFSDGAMALKIDQVSPIVETPDGFHIIQLIEKRGDQVNVRHILRKPKVSDAALTKAINDLDSISDEIRRGEYTFDECTQYVSQDKETKNNYGIMYNPEDNSSKFELKDLAPEVAKVVADLNIGEISKPFIMVNNKGREVVAVVKLKNKINGHRATMKDDYQALQNLVISRMSESKLESWIREMQKTTYIRVNEDWRNCEFRYPGWIK